MSQKPGGVGIYTCDGVSKEVATSKCAHCQNMTEIPNMRQMTDYVDVCRMCNALICLQCAGKPCTPVMRRIEEAEREFYRKMQFRKSLGV